ncbi:hypothetical protein V6N13_088295 [Hibiscus sabdariffa]
MSQRPHHLCQIAQATGHSQKRCDDSSELALQKMQDVAKEDKTPQLASSTFVGILSCNSFQVKASTFGGAKLEFTKQIPCF